MSECGARRGKAERSRRGPPALTGSPCVPRGRGLCSGSGGSSPTPLLLGQQARLLGPAAGHRLRRARPGPVRGIGAVAARRPWDSGFRSSVVKCRPYRWELARPRVRGQRQFPVRAGLGSRRRGRHRAHPPLRPPARPPELPHTHLHARTRGNSPCGCCSSILIRNAVPVCRGEEVAPLGWRSPHPISCLLLGPPSDASPWDASPLPAQSPRCGPRPRWRDSRGVRGAAAHSQGHLLCSSRRPESEASTDVGLTSLLCLQEPEALLSSQLPRDIRSQTQAAVG